MPMYGEWIAATIASSNSESAACDLGRDYDYLSVQIPAMDECKLSLKVAEKLASTYYKLGEGKSTDTETFNRGAIWILGGWRYIKVVASRAQTAERLIRVRGMRN